MATIVPATPLNFIVQQGNAQVFLSWNLSAGATSYPVYRSTDNVAFALLATASTNSYLDTAVTVGTTYYYKVAATNADGDSPFSGVGSAIPTNSGIMALGQVRLLSQQMADRVNSNFVTMPEWNTYINQSYFELYDLLVTTYGDEYFVAEPYKFTTDGTEFFDLPTDFYKLMGIDLGLNGASAPNAGWVTLKRFNFIARNRYVFPQTPSGYYAVNNPQYHLLGNQVQFIPPPSAGQVMRLWYVPRMTQLLQDTDMLDGISGWTEYVCVDAAIKALMKEESDTSMLMMRKQGLLKRIEATAQNRDVGEPQTISDTRRYTNLYGFGSPNGDAPSGGF